MLWNKEFTLVTFLKALPGNFFSKRMIVELDRTTYETNFSNLDWPYCLLVFEKNNPTK